MGPWQDVLVSDEGTEEIAGTLGIFGAPPVAATARVVRQSRQRRMRRALGALGLCWGAAIPCLFIPLAHFFLVPTLVTTGIVLAVLRWTSRPADVSRVSGRWTARAVTTA